MAENLMNNSSISTIQFFIIYLIVMNFIAFFAMWLDKQNAKKGRWRISEPHLLVLALFGGSIGELIGIYTFRHKTKKKRFTVGVPAIIAVQAIIIITLFI